MNSPFYHFEQEDVYQCMGCLEMLEVPGAAVLHAGRRAEPIKANPENRAIWLELHEIAHRKCSEFQDIEKARQYREHSLKRIPRRAVAAA